MTAPADDLDKLCPVAECGAKDCDKHRQYANATALPKDDLDKLEAVAEAALGTGDGYSDADVSAWLKFHRAFDPPTVKRLIARARDAEEEAATLTKQLAVATNMLEDAATWRERALAFDDDMGNVPREFCEDVELIEAAAGHAMVVIENDGEEETGHP